MGNCAASQQNTCDQGTQSSARAKETNIGADNNVKCHNRKMFDIHALPKQAEEDEETKHMKEVRRKSMGFYASHPPPAQMRFR